MNPSLIRSPALAAGLALSLAPAVRAQLVVAATAGAVHYDSQSSTSSLALNPEVRYEGRRFVVDAGGGYTAGSDGGRVADGSATIWAATRPTTAHFQLDGLFQASTTHPQADSSSSSVFALGEVALALQDRGVAAGLGTVQASIRGTPSVSALRTEVRGWLQVADGDVTLTASIEPTRLQDAWFTEFAGGAEWTPGGWDVSGGLRLRQASGSTALGGAGSVSRDLTPRLAAELNMGRYLRDPYQGLPPGYFISLGVRVKVATWKGGAVEGVSAATLGDISLKAAERSFGFAPTGLTTHRSVSQLPAAKGGSSGRGSGISHRP